MFPPIATIYLPPKITFLEKTLVARSRSLQRACNIKELGVAWVRVHIACARLASTPGSFRTKGAWGRG